jgi:hypothetical protein
MSLNTIKEKIEKMDKYHQIEILRILSNCTEVTLNENNNGTFINLTELSTETIKELEKYTDYVNEQQKQLKDVEKEKEQLEEKFF